MFRTSSQFFHGKNCFLTYIFLCLSNLLLQASEGILTGRVFPQINVCSCLGCTHIYAELSLCIAALYKAFCLHVICTVSEFMKKRKEKALCCMLRIGTDCTSIAHMPREIVRGKTRISHNYSVVAL